MGMCCICATPMMQWMLHMCKLHLCAEHVQATAIPHICTTCMLLMYATCAACTHACYRYAAQVSLAYMHVTTVLHTHTAYTHASY